MSLPDGRVESGAHLTFSSPLARYFADSGLDVVITGAGGWIGRAALEMMESALGEAFPSRVHAYSSVRKTLYLRSERRLISEPLGRLRDLTIGPHVLVHLAFVTREQVGTQSLESYVKLNDSISAAVLDHVRRFSVEGVFLPSSGAVYGADGAPSAELATNPYGALKLRDEARFSDLSPLTAIVRVFNLSGPFLNKANNYALGSVISDLIRGGPIRLHADHPVIRSYVHVRDLVELAFAVMLGLVAGPGTPFDTAGDREIEIGELAHLATSVLGVPGVRVERQPLAEDAPPDRYVGDGSHMMRIVSRCGFELTPLEVQLLDTAAYLRGPQTAGSPELPGR